MNITRSLMMSAKPVISMLIALAVALGLIGVSGAAPALAKATTFIDNVQVPVNIPVFIPCASGGAGEIVDLSGTFHVLFHATIDDSDGYHSKFHVQPQGVSGTGLTTGDKYQGTGVIQDAINDKVGSESTFVSNFKIIGQGSGNNLLVHENFHVTVNANGEVTAFVDDFSVECK